MADLTDALNAVVALLAQALYPNGTGQPSATGDATIVYQGWPTASQLDADLAGFSNGKGGRVHVTVFPLNGEKLVPAYSNAWTPMMRTAATISVAIAGLAITLGGTISTPQNVALIVNGSPYTYAVQAGDSLTSIATALAAQIPGASSAGPVVTLQAASKITAARAGGSGTMQRELRRQVRPVQVTVWADTPARREACARILDVALAATEFVALPDQTGARLVYQTSHQIDGQQKENLYRRDIIYTAEYATTQTMTGTEVVIGKEVLAFGVVGGNANISTKTIVQ